MKKSIIVHSIITILLLLGCNNTTENKEANNSDKKDSLAIAKDLDEMKEDGVLRVLVKYSSTSYFLYRGQPMGFEYELLERLAESLGLELDLVLVDNIDSILKELNEGKADIAAYGLTITSDRKKEVAFTDYLYLTSQVLVQKKPDNWRNINWSNLQRHLLHDAIDLIGDTVAVRKNSSYLERLSNLSEELGDDIHIDTLPGHLSTEKIIKKVVDGDLKYTVADKNLAKINATYYPILDVKVPISFSQRVAWAVRKSSPKLLEAINKWIQKEKDDIPYYVIYNKYFKNKRDFRRRIKSEFLSLNGNQISEYDEMIKEYAEGLDWDWRLVTSLVYQESRFQPKAESWAGAQGLMQVMPRTAKELGITNPADPEQSLRGGTKYLKQLYRRFEDIPDSVERIKFTMAAYNCGYYHVKDAQTLAEQNGLETTEWDENVEKALLDLSYPSNYTKEGIEYGFVRGIEPVTYVEQIFERFGHYEKFIEE